MRFTSYTLVAALACDSAAAFGGFSSTFSGSRFSATTTRQPVVSGRGAMSMGLSDLESKLFTTPAPEPSKPSKPVPAPKAAPPAPRPAPKPKAAKADPKKAEPKKAEPVVELKLLAPEPVPTPVAKSAPKGPAKKVSYDLPKEVKKPRVKAPQSDGPSIAFPKFELPKALTRKAAEKIVKSAPTDPANPLAGVAIGAAPLVAAPLLALVAGRDLLTKTKTRRDQLQKEVEVVKAKRAQKIVAETDGAGLAKALVS
jgi:hypothetical protein